MGEIAGSLRLSRLNGPVQVSGETMLCSCPAGTNDKSCKHVAAVEMYQESQVLLDNARSLVLITGLERSLEDKLADLY